MDTLKDLVEQSAEARASMSSSEEESSSEESSDESDYDGRFDTVARVGGELGFLKSKEIVLHYISGSN